jgi:uncharacterized membrane protein (DUF373 family)
MGGIVAPTTQERAWPIRRLGALLSGFESVLYGVVGALLVVSAAFVLVGTVTATVDAVSAGRDSSEIGVIVLDRILLTLIVAELMYSIRLVMQTHEIAPEPFLFIGLIAALRRILIVTADFERPQPGPGLTNLLIELGVLGFLVVGLAGALFLVRRSERSTGFSGPLSGPPSTPSS